MPSQSDFNQPEESNFAPVLAHWYEHHKRDLPWRHTRDPYRIWLSEIILQQTRVAQGMPYYKRFVEAYPTVTHMAEADERDVLRLWQGLGYYSRARNLHQTAKLVANEHAGLFPGTYHKLLTLKGIGTYTAAAIASFAFGERVAVVDGNVYRVLARVFGIEDDITTTSAKKRFAALATRLIAHADDPATFNQAIMEFGAIQCTPTSPDCLLCPLQQQCVAFQTGRQQVLPVKAKKAAVRERFFHYFVFRNGDRLALRERTERDIWQNLYDFALVETDKPKTGFRQLELEKKLEQLVLYSTQTAAPTKATQLLSHQRIRATFYEFVVPDRLTDDLFDGLSWFSVDQVAALPKPLLIVNYLKTHLEK
ncbi:A/G-specific adenine glycosylase [Rudanella lutea]|uniref:A/G-specific adenine glycosylase n=1 Tax=Rudanella lutea TaxID=451374 RepID=UPI0009FF4CB0|nr:A/G-specific adenine glycosylase [Rudanella lutea]